MRSVLIFSGIYPPDIGGPATFIPQFETYLTSLGSEFHTITLDNGIHWLPVRKPRFSSISRRILLPVRILKVVREGLRWVQSKDVIFSNGLYEEAAIVSVLSGKPLVSKVVGVPAWEALRQTVVDDSVRSKGIEMFDKELLPMFLRFRNKFWEWSLRQSSLIVTPSIELALYIESLRLGTLVKVIENGTDIAHSVSASCKYDVVTTVRLVPWKNVDILILAAKSFDFTLAIVGDGPERALLEHLAAGDQRIRFLGALDSSSTIRILASSRIFSLVSSYEGLSYSLIEAWALGKSSVVSIAKGNLDALKGSDVSLRVPVRDVKATGVAIRMLLDDDLLRSTKENEARAFALVHYEKNRQLGKILKEIDEI